MKSIDQRAVTHVKKIAPLPFVETAVALLVPIAVTIRGGESLVVRLVQKSYRARID
ncbi:MAG: hypothetical protein V3R35_09875 [Woeseiaceae bacterium]